MKNELEALTKSSLRTITLKYSQGPRRSPEITLLGHEGGGRRCSLPVGFISRPNMSGDVPRKQSAWPRLRIRVGITEAT